MCCICLSPSSSSVFLSRLKVPVHQNVVIKEQTLAIDIPKGDLKLAYCSQCGFVFNEAFDINKLSYNELYDNTQDLSPAFKEHVQSLVHHLIVNKNVTQCTITEIGCGKGGFLKLLIEDKEMGNSGYGFDPAYVGPKCLYEGRLNIERSFYDEKASLIPTDIVICRHVIEHIPNPLEFLTLIKRTLLHSPHARLFFETPCLKWILNNQVIWDFFYEHCSYFTATSLRRAFEQAGFQVESVRHVFEGQYLWLEASLPSPKLSSPLNPLPGETLETLIQNYVDAEDKLKNSWREQLKALKGEYKIALWGAGAKGVTFANLIDPTRELIDCIIDINPGKQHSFTPGSGHPIVSYHEAAKRGVNKAFIMNSNYKKESQEMLLKENIPIELN